MKIENQFLEILFNFIIVMAPYLMLGFFVAGLIHVFVSSEKIKKSFGAKGLMGVLKASLLGVPLPLCSCAVIPSAVTLKKNGATNGATSAFLISTPESGVDSIMVTYAMMGLPMAIIRPVTAFASAFFAGVLQLIFNNEDYSEVIEAAPTSCCGPKKPCSSKVVERTSLAAKFAKTIKFSYIELIDDMAGWLFLGIVAAVCIEFFAPADIFEGLNPTTGRLIILGLGIPLYICASASTPIAASLIMKGMSPGMALLFLLVGPATNISNIFVLNKYIGKKGVLINVFSIGFVALIASYITDYLFSSMGWNLVLNASSQGHLEHAGWLEISLSIIFICLLLRSLLMNEVPKYIKKFLNKPSSGCCG